MSPGARRKSVDSSDSDSDSSKKGHYDKKDKKDKKDKQDKKDKKDKKDKDKDKKDKTKDHGAEHHVSTFPHTPSDQEHRQYQSGHGHGGQVPLMPQEPSPYHHDNKAINPAGHSPSPSGHIPPAAPPPSGYRLPLSTTAPFPSPQQAGQPPCYEFDSVTPVYIGSALFESSVHPCKVGPHLSPPASVPYGGSEYAHHGRYDLLPFTPETMELVRTSYGRIPPGRRPVEGGYEVNGEKLYHGVAVVQGVRVPGKTGEHLGACNVAFAGGEHAVTENYEILCWR